MDDLRYPIGQHDVRAPVGAAGFAAAIDDIEMLPRKLRAAVGGLDDAQLDTPYRPGGWTVRQVVHHVGDSHANAYVRLRLALTEERPTIRAYDEKRWAELADARTLPVEPTLTLLDGLHRRWTTLLRSLGPRDAERRLVHPEVGELTIAQLTGLYGWHSRHHLAHVTGLVARSGWTGAAAGR